MHDDHSKISIAEYRTEAKKLQAVQCTLHPELPYVEGCENCLTAFCVQCKVKAGSCKAGMYIELDWTLHMHSTHTLDAASEKYSSP